MRTPSQWCQRSKPVGIIGIPKFLASQIERPGPAHASPEGMTVVVHAKMSQTHRRLTADSGIGSNFQNTATYPKLFSTNHGSMMFLDMVIR